uniref:[histone H3]-lysine(36) N-trimethyltransferase n=1 Tax=Wuchereria bancrofti TaxID=6293 RepID=A0AAF5Q0R0_WUCBA
MSIKLMKQRWLVEEMDDKKDSTEIVDMDVDEKDEYEIISEMEKPSNFLTQRDVENEEPEAIGINMHTQGNVASLEVKRPSRWDVGAPFCIQLNDALAPNTSDIVMNKCTTSLDEACNGYSKTTDENERKEMLTNETIALKTLSTKMEKCTESSEISIAAEHGYHQDSCVDLSLDKIALPYDPCDIALPPEPSELCGNVSCALLPRITNDKLASEATLDKGKVIIKWKFTKTPKELPTGDVKIWEPEVETRELPKLCPEEESRSQRCVETSLDSRTVAERSDSYRGESSLHTKSLLQHSADVEGATLSPCSSKPKSSIQSQGNTTLLCEQDQSDYAMHEMKILENQCVQITTLQKASEEQSTSNKDLESSCDNVSEIVLSSSKLHYNHNLKMDSRTLLDNETKRTAETSVQKTVTSWFSKHFPQEPHLKETKLPSESLSFLQQQWMMNVSKIETNGEGEQESSVSSVSSATSVSMYSFNSTPKTLPSSDLAILRTAEGRKRISETADTVNVPADSTGSANNEPLLSEPALDLNEDEGELDVSTLEISPMMLKSANEPVQYEHLDENIILCDESLIKEAKVVRCFCEPTSAEIAEGRGCSSGCINRELYTECGSRCPSGAGCANRRFHNKQYAKVEVFNAGIKGWGLRAAEPLEPGRFIIEYVGEVIDAEEMIRRGRRYGKDPKHVHHYLMALKNGAVIDATAKGNVSRFINHSCDPNCESQKWTVNRQLRVGFFVIKPIALGEEIVFDYQLERYGRKAQRCFCGAANCRGRIGDDSESEEEDKISDEAEVEESGTDNEVLLTKRKLKSEKKEKSLRIAKKRKRQPSAQRCNKAIVNALSRGPPRNRTQVRDLVRLMVQVEQAPQRSSLIQCIRFAHPDVLRLFIQESGLRLLYVFLATDYPIDDEQSVLQLQIKSLDLLNVMPIVNKNQLIDSHLASTVEKITSRRGPVDEVVEDIVRKLEDAVCCDIPSTSKHPTLTLSKDPDPVIERLHYEMVTKAAKLMEKWRNLREEYRIPRRERTDPVPTQHDISRYVRKTDEDERNKRVIVDKKDDGSTLWRLSGFGPPPKKRCFDRRRLPKTDLPIFVKDLTHLENEDFKQSPITVTDSLRINEDDEGENKPKKRRSRFDIVGERNPSSMYELYAADCDFYAPPPPKLLPEALFAAGLPDSVNFTYSEHSFPEFFDWNTVYAKYDPSSAAYQQFINYYQQQQYPMMGLLPCPLTPQNATEITNILEAPSPPPPKRPKTPEERPNMLVIGPIDVENPTDEDIELLEKHLITLKAKRAEIRKRLQEAQRTIVQESNDMSDVPPPPPPSQTKQSLWIQATTEEGAVYYYNKETRESVWTLPDESEGGNASADTTTIDTRATFKVEIVKYVGGMLEPIRKLKFASADDYKYVLRKLTHTILEKELKRVGETELKVTESVRDKARKFVAEYLARLGDGQVFAYYWVLHLYGFQALIYSDEASMNRVKIRRIFPRNRFYIGVLLDWKESVDDRNFRSVLCRALISLKAYPLEIATFTDLKNIRGIGDQIARKLEESWDVFCSQNLTTPSLKQINQMKKGEFLQFLNRSSFLEKKSRPPQTMEALSADSVGLLKSKNVEHLLQRVDITNVKQNGNHIRKRIMRTVQPLQSSKKVALENEGTSSSSVTINESYCGEVQVIRRPGALNVKMVDYVTDDVALIGSVADDDKMEHVCTVSQEYADSIIYHPSAFSNAQIILIIDNRESANTRKFQQMCSLFQKKGIFYEMRSLSIGDYLWVMRMCDGTEMVLDTIVERKTLDDLWSSIVQKRYEEQKQRLISIGIPNIVYILEGPLISVPSLEQALVTTHIENRFLVYRTSSVEHTSLVLSKIAKRLTRKATSHELTGMSFEKFQKTSKKTQRRSVKDVFLRQLVVCPQISIQKAAHIVDRFPSFAALTVFYSSLPKNQRATALSENFLGITKSVSAHIAKFYSEV